MLPASILELRVCRSATVRAGFRIIAVLLVGACASPPSHHEPPRPSPDDLEVPDRFGSPPSLELIPVQVLPEEPLEDAFARATQAYRAENIPVFDARRAYATSAASQFAWYFTINDADDVAGRTQHTFFVVTEPWSLEDTRRFLLSYVVMAAAPATEIGRPWFHFYSAHEPPLAARFLFSNTPEGTLEATLLTEIGAVGWPAETTPDVADWIVEQMVELGLARRQDFSAPCPERLDEIMGRLPRPSESEPDHLFGRDYVPEASLVAIGVLVGESIRTALAGAAEWEADVPEIPYPRLRVRGVADGVLRPIPLMVEIFAADAGVGPTDYCHRVIDRLGPTPTPSPARAEPDG